MNHNILSEESLKLIQSILLLSKINQPLIEKRGENFVHLSVPLKEMSLLAFKDVLLYHKINVINVACQRKYFQNHSKLIASCAVNVSFHKPSFTKKIDLHRNQSEVL